MIFDAEQLKTGMVILEDGEEIEITDFATDGEEFPEIVNWWGRNLRTGAPIQAAPKAIREYEVVRGF